MHFLVEPEIMRLTLILTLISLLHTLHIFSYISYNVLKGGKLDNLRRNIGSIGDLDQPQKLYSPHVLIHILILIFGLCFILYFLNCQLVLFFYDIHLIKKRNAMI